MTIDEAIKHCLEVAEQNERKAEYRPRMDYYDEIESRADCLECAADHRQLAEWLTELKELKSTDVKPIRHGQWENEYLDDDDVWYADCTNCNNETHSRFGRVSVYAYCPNCGARMDGDTRHSQ